MWMNSSGRIGNRDEDREFVWAFLRHARAQGVGIDHLAKLLNHLRPCAQIMPVPFSKVNRKDIEAQWTPQGRKPSSNIGIT